MKHRVLWLVLTLVVLAGCGAVPQTPDTAVPVARTFMDAWVAGNAATMYPRLTQAARQAMTREVVAAHLRTQRVSYESLGAPGRRTGTWLQVPVRGLTIRLGDGEVRWPEVLLTLYHDGKQWQVAWAAPLMTQAMLTYESGAYADQLTIGQTIAAIDPYHYRGYLEQHFASRGLKRYREAELWLIRAQETATPAELPDVRDAAARFKLSLGDAYAAVVQARQALESAGPLIPATYSKRWQADTLVVLAQALWKTGDKAGTDEAVRQAAAADPENAPLAVFRSRLTTLSPPAPPKS